ncbi:hypothetical protein PAXINDRAFT_19506 [Paxillus involutus ATCC 200175]|uniref:Uncharacterized protein n=1 Tax=Paxillus involutus ATCC 200175 TaxID=664439 RepID=A0A0C9SWQ8_PAXIN|nr:hypothetical protein PAXINDRAFT_19506 [Paxillus involutus ATCC 200175]
MANTPFPRLSRVSFQVVQTWLHCHGAAIEVALTCPVLQDQKAYFAELLIAEGCQISAFIAAYPDGNKLSMDPLFSLSQVPLPAIQQWWRPFHEAA